MNLEQDLKWKRSRTVTEIFHIVLTLTKDILRDDARLSTLCLEFLTLNGHGYVQDLF